MYRVMLVEDDTNLRKQIADTLRIHGYDVYEVTDFTSVLPQVDKVLPELIILDINLPYYDGNYICHSIRKKYQMPVIITSARNSDADQILSMELGSDDYIVKPFSINVLLSHIAAALRRAYGEYNTTADSDCSINGLQLNERGMKLNYKQQIMDLSKNEYILLKMFFESAGKVLTREELLEAIWDDRDFVDDNTLTVNVTRIKKKLEQLGLPGLIKTKRGVGYLFDSEEMV